MVRSGYSYCSSTPYNDPCLKVNTVRFNPGWTKPSTVQASRFSFFSRATILALAPLSTASTRGIESFHRKPNGGSNSSAARLDANEQNRATLNAMREQQRAFGRMCINGEG